MFVHPQKQPIVATEGSVGATSDFVFTGGSTDSVFTGVTSAGTINSEGIFSSNGEDTIIL